MWTQFLGAVETPTGWSYQGNEKGRLRLIARKALFAMLRIGSLVRDLLWHFGVHAGSLFISRSLFSMLWVILRRNVKFSLVDIETGESLPLTTDLTGMFLCLSISAPNVTRTSTTLQEDPLFGARSRLNFILMIWVPILVIGSLFLHWQVPSSFPNSIFIQISNQSWRLSREFSSRPNFLL